MKRYYDKNRKELIYYQNKATEDFWDSRWTKIGNPTKTQLLVSRFNFVVKNTRKFLPKGSKIIEGGCGRGQNVINLNHLGYPTVGVDYAKKTIKKLKKIYSEEKFVNADVRKLPFDTESYNGYWSLGVIEHFFEGYDKIIEEAHRVLKRKGILFMAFPQMSKLRKKKARKNKYLTKKATPKDFYQFCLEPEQVIKNIESKGFKLLKTEYISGVKGCKDEIKFGSKILGKLENSKNVVGKIIVSIINKILNKYTGHSILLIFEKK